MTTTDIICTECNTKPRLKSLDKNSGTCVGCDCDGAKYSMDMVPYELEVSDLPAPWEMEEGEFPNLTEEQVNAPGINDYVEVQEYARRQEELARERGRKNAEAAFDKSSNQN